MAEARAEQLPEQLRRAFVICFVTGLIALIPALFVTYGSVMLSLFTYLSWSMDDNLDFLQGDGAEKTDPIEVRHAVPRTMVLLVSLFTVGFILLDAACIFAIAVGVMGMGRKNTRVAIQVCLLVLPTFLCFQTSVFVTVPFGIPTLIGVDGARARTRAPCACMHGSSPWLLFSVPPRCALKDAWSTSITRSNLLRHSHASQPTSAHARVCPNPSPGHCFQQQTGALHRALLIFASSQGPRYWNRVQSDLIDLQSQH